MGPHVCLLRTCPAPQGLGRSGTLTPSPPGWTRYDPRLRHRRPFVQGCRRSPGAPPAAAEGRAPHLREGAGQAAPAVLGAGAALPSTGPVLTASRSIGSVRASPVQHGRPSALLRALALRQEPALDPVGVRVPALLREEFGLPLGHHVPVRQAERGQAPALPHSGRDTGFVLGGAQRRVRGAVAVADHHATEQVAPPVPRANWGHADHRPWNLGADRHKSAIRGPSRRAGRHHQRPGVCRRDGFLCRGGTSSAARTRRCGRRGRTG